MRYIKQKFMTDCFPTCIAMVADIPHAKALKEVHPRRKKGSSYGTYYWLGMSVLKRLGFEIKIKHLPSYRNMKLSSIKKLSILRLQWKRKGKQCNHVVIYDPLTKKILDPARPKPHSRATYERRAISIIEISK